jgi:hypothetical protein
MRISIEIHGDVFRIDPLRPLSIAIPLKFNGAQPNAYGVSQASSAACETGALVGDTRRGGSCNFEEYHLIPHCNGTHTECAGHLTDERISVNDCLGDAFIPALLISVDPENALDSIDSYPFSFSSNDKMITRRAVETAVTNLNFQFSDFKSADSSRALIVRVLPNDDDKLSKMYLTEIPPFFSNEAMEFIDRIGIRHLLVDLPSIDRIYDDGQLSNHRIFWKIPAGAFAVSENTDARRTITELIYVPPDIPDGNYLLNLQIAPFATDASPSRPLLFQLVSA